ncbi:MAG: hypothetical protein AVDCRST_MAG67-15 [uncultured Solirubrobacteraceae bacterium]|uniref:Uncharacterized protein n=1 Tax=uncultured Solirubrobacteraceae bacterium TaxID=1162706 RepID=A0A6J4RLK1_9ACTN|nr:MAG: hypothetical protein AVDCRST_MAG67-15 [uncultured Solirubrobacteraceae bacterium]
MFWVFAFRWGAFIGSRSHDAGLEPNARQLGGATACRNRGGAVDEPPLLVVIARLPYHKVLLGNYPHYGAEGAQTLVFADLSGLPCRVRTRPAS